MLAQRDPLPIAVAEQRVPGVDHEHVERLRPRRHAHQLVEPSAPRPRISTAERSAVGDGDGEGRDAVPTVEFSTNVLPAVIRHVRQWVLQPVALESAAVIRPP